MSVIDLSAPLGPDTVMWPGAPAPATEDVATFADNGYFARLLHVFEHSGTHFDAPCHMVENHSSVDEVPVGNLVAPVRVIDISDDLGDDADGVLTVEQVLAHEAEHGLVPEGCAVFLRTGWEEHHTDAERYAGPPGDLRFPGFGAESAQLLVDRGVVPGAQGGVAPPRGVAPGEPRRPLLDACLGRVGGRGRAQARRRLRLPGARDRAGALGIPRARRRQRRARPTWTRAPTAAGRGPRAVPAGGGGTPRESYVDPPVGASRSPSRSDSAMAS
jgi:kynurenine formamidase